MAITKYINDCYDRGYSAIADKIEAFSNNEKASMSGSAIAILVLLVTLLLCALLFGTLQAQTDTKIAALNDSAATASYNNVKATGWSSIDLFSMIPYVAVFVVLLGMLMGVSRND
ncbi:hypothetical protein MSKOL_1622 [Methanosarcina sp. Kolksee]|uniref:hypothetical protein n=1 Tax=Methanosarcina sp. Kolksee TaxID=1434099 RepID=UPI000615694D|nr:hypothetical protein [Methanosarcina sp. Kolksee]AKB47399.1 hypothetical protein MSKOL_1622 [Methanosarcina sp. Kolksee]